MYMLFCFFKLFLIGLKKLRWLGLTAINQFGQNPESKINHHTHYRQGKRISSLPIFGHLFLLTLCLLSPSPSAVVIIRIFHLMLLFANTTHT